MTPEMLRARLDAARATQQALIEQRAKLAEAMLQAVGHLNGVQGRIEELQELLTLMEAAPAAPNTSEGPS